MNIPGQMLLNRGTDRLSRGDILTLRSLVGILKMMDITSLVSKSKALIDLPRGRTKHFSFLLRKSKVLSIGWNQADKTHPMAAKYGYKYPFLHSELHCLIAYTGKLDELQRCTLINIRIGKRGDVRMSKPCECCQHVIRAFRLGETYYTNTCGGLSRL